MSTILEPAGNCWRIDKADHFSLIIDADNYFAAAREAMKKARRSIFLVGWDFDARITLGHPRPTDGAPAGVGDFFLWLAENNPDLEIRLLQWYSGFVTTWLKGINFYYLMRWKWHRQITVRLDGKHPLGGSHHQKILVIDDNIAFCGGIDVTLDRWDTRKHRDDDPGRRRPNGRPYGPWHDASSVVTGEAARALGDLCRLRWQMATGETLDAVEAAPIDPPRETAFALGPVDLAIARSSPAYGGRLPVREIEALYLDMIAAAKTAIYAESQYFASRRIAQAIARRLSEEDGPEVVLINPVAADNWLGALAMDTARARLRESLRRHDNYGRFRIYHPVTAKGQKIYVHSKLMIVDDRLLRVGSSNFNNRSMRLDNECDVACDAATDPSGHLASRLRALRADLLAEHLGLDPAHVAETIEAEGSLIRAIEILRHPPGSAEAPAAGPTLIPYDTPELSGLAEWLADNEILDPDGPEETFEPITRRGLFRGRLKLPHRPRIRGK